MRKRTEVSAFVTVVALLLPAMECQGDYSKGITYVDAADGPGGNTTFADGSLFEAHKTSPVGNDNQWTLRPLGNGGTVFTSNDGAPSGPEDAPLLVTTIRGLTPGAAYNVYAYFWSDQNSWQLIASLTSLAEGASAQSGVKPPPRAQSTLAVATDFANQVMVEEANRQLYQAPLGQATADARGEIRVWIDDFPNAASVNRTWYDGVGYALASKTEAGASTGLAALVALIGLLIAGTVVVLMRGRSRQIDAPEEET